MQVMQDAQRLEATGHDIMHLEVGQPSTPPPDAVNRALTAALGRTATHGYSVAFGHPALRQRISAHYQDWYGIAPGLEPDCHYPRIITWICHFVSGGF